MSTLTNIGFVKQVAGMGTSNFPELAEKVFIVNAPWAAVKGFNLVKPMLPKATQAKIQISGEDASGIPALQELVDLDQLPSWLGGTGSERGAHTIPEGLGIDMALLGVSAAGSIPKGLGGTLPTSTTPKMMGSMG
jgi:hypothetical protein